MRIPSMKSTLPTVKERLLIIFSLGNCYFSIKYEFIGIHCEVTSSDSSVTRKYELEE